MTDIKLPPYPEGLCLREDIEDYAREAVRLNATVPEISTEHGPWIESNIHEGETYCQRCLTRSVFAGNRECDPHIVSAAPASPQPAQQPLTDERLRQMHHEDEFGLFCDYDDFEQIARAVEQAHGIGVKP